MRDGRLLGLDDFPGRQARYQDLFAVRILNGRVLA